MIKVTKPKFKKTLSFLNKLEKFDARGLLDEAGRMGVSRLAAETPVDSGVAAGSWSYKIKGNKEKYKLIWTNTEMAGRAPLVLILQYGHATKSGGFVSGRDFINPALKPVYEFVERRLIQEAIQ